MSMSLLLYIFKISRKILWKNSDGVMGLEYLLKIDALSFLGLDEYFIDAD